MSDQFELCTVCRLANHRELVRLTDFETENAELRVEVDRLKKESRSLQDELAYVKNQLLNEAIRDISHGKF